MHAIGRGSFRAFQIVSMKKNGGEIPCNQLCYFEGI
jgi:hypothetical protein